MDIKRFEKKWRSNPIHYNSDVISTSTDELGHKVDIALIFSGRNRGKSFDISTRALERAWRSKGVEQFGYLRRFDKELKHSTIVKYFDDKIEFIKDLTDNECDCITVENDGIYFAFEQVIDGKVKKIPVLKCADFFALNNATQYKSLQYPKITTLIFEEVFTADRYLPDECDKLLSIISTIHRSRDNFTCFMISNTVSRVNPYTKGLSLKGMLKQKQGTIDFYKLYKGTFDADGNEEYFYIASEYLKDADNEMQPKLLDSKRNRVTSITSNKWDELHQYVHCTNKWICDYFTNDKVVFELDGDRFLCTLSRVPFNIEDIIEKRRDEEEYKASEDYFTILYVERKTTPTHISTRLYTNIARVNPYTTKRFKRKYPIDDVVLDCISSGYIIYTDNLTANEFNQVLKELY